MLCGNGYAITTFPTAITTKTTQKYEKCYPS